MLRLRTGVSAVAIITTLGASLAACVTEPPIDEGLAPPATSVVEGDVIITVPLDGPHNVVVFLQQVLFDDQGVPLDPSQYPLVNLAVVPGAELDQGGSPPVRTGTYVFSRVPAADPATVYIAWGIVDVDDNFFPGAESPITAADLIGGYVDATTGSSAFLVSPGAVLSEINLVFSTPAAG